jgi:hypothetical protein
MRSLFLAAVAAAAVTVLPLTPASASAGPSLPKPESTVIKPNVGLGGVRLGQKSRPREPGWKRPFKCMELDGMSGCVWTTRKDALPPAGEQGIRGPFAMQMGRGRVEGLILSSGTRDTDPRPLRRWKTRKGIGFTSTLEQFLAAYPGAKLNASTGSYSILARGNISTFVFAAGTLNTIEMYTCEAYQDC